LSDVLATLDRSRVINATGTVTRLGASRIAPQVLAAMTAAAASSVDIAQLQGGASEVIARLTGAQAGIVTCGAMAGLLVGAAACLTGFDPVKMSRLPDTSGMRNEFVVSRSHRNSYDHGVRAAGARLVEVGLADRLTGCGVRDAEAWEYEAAIGDQTAGVLYLARADSRPALPAVVRAAHRTGTPVLVDAAAELPPAGNLRRYIEEGADLVVFSGGKALGGPSATGILCGQRSLVGAALLQQLDLDYVYEDWTPPPNLIDKRALPGVPRHGIGRSCKVGKEQIAGLIEALERFATDTDAARNERWALIADAVLGALSPLRGITARATCDALHADLPLVEVRVVGPHPTAADLATRLRTGSPSIHVDATHADEGQLLVVPTCLELEDAAVIGVALARLTDEPTGENR
jgi:L-seryl-tRNA(Ser) seleniumtransferase